VKSGIKKISRARDREGKMVRSESSVNAPEVRKKCFQRKII